MKHHFESNRPVILFVRDRDPRSEFLVRGGLDTTIDGYLDVYGNVEGPPVGRIVDDRGFALWPGRIAGQESIEV